MFFFNEIFASIFLMIWSSSQTTLARNSGYWVVNPNRLTFFNVYMVENVNGTEQVVKKFQKTVNTV